VYSETSNVDIVDLVVKNAHTGLELQGKPGRPMSDGTVRQAVFVNTAFGLRVLNYYPRWQPKETTPLLMIEDVIGINSSIATIQLDGRNLYARAIQVIGVTQYGLIVSSRLPWMMERLIDPPNRANPVTYATWWPFIAISDVHISSQGNGSGLGGVGLVGDGYEQLFRFASSNRLILGDSVGRSSSQIGR
jgi:hypothetical protein